MDPLFTVSQVMEATGGKLATGSADVSITGVSIDSRTLQPGDVFIAIAGPRFDGHEFTQAAAQGGAFAMIVSDERREDTCRTLGPDIPIVAVSHTEHALQCLARWYRERFDIPVVGITGSCGKTTVKDLVVSTLGTRYSVAGTRGNLNNELGVPLTLFEIDSGTEIAVVEMGVNAPGEMDQLCDIAIPNAGAITSIGEAHLEGFGSIETLAEEKARLAHRIGENGVLFISADDVHCRRVAGEFPGTCVRFGFDRSAEFRVSKVKMDVAEGMSVTVNDTEFNVGIYGRHNAANVAATVAVSRHFGLTGDQVQAGFRGYVPAPMRMEVTQVTGITVINDTYNANPDSVRCALETLARWTCNGSRIAVLGEMKELGDFAESAHEEMGRVSARLQIDQLLVLGEHAGAVIRGAGSEAGAKVHATAFRTHEQLLETLVNLARRGDVILVKGSRAAEMDRVVYSFIKGRTLC